MGMFDDYGTDDLRIQLKVGPCLMKEYHIGDDVEIPDGVYVAYEGVVVILDGKLARVFDCLISKWGGRIDPQEVINPLNPIMKHIDEQT